MTAERTQFEVPDRLGEGGAFLAPTSDPAANLPLVLRTMSKRSAPIVATLTALKAIAAKDRTDGMQALVLADGSRWRFKAASSATANDLTAAAPAAGTGRWVRMVGAAALMMPIAFGTLDAAILLTVQTGCVIHPREFFWDITTSFSGGTNAAIGLSSSTLASKTTKGDLLGGAGGDVAAAITSTIGWTPGTIGANWDTLAKRRILMKATDTIRYDRVVDAFTAGAGYAVLTCDIIAEAT